MGDLKKLAEKVEELEERLARLEERVGEQEDDEELMEAWYEQAKKLVMAQGKASLTLIQRKLWIDMARAEKILARLEAEGVVGPDRGAEPRKVRNEKR